MSNDPIDERCNWKTPASIWKCITYVRLVDDGALAITLEGGDFSTDPNYNPKYTFKWNRFYAYKRTKDDIDLPWDRTVYPAEGGAYECFHLINNSSWIGSWNRRTGYLEVHFPGARHYVILTEESTFEVISNHEPEVTIE